MPYQVLADLVLASHVLIVAFVVLGLLLIIVGSCLRWSWVNALWFRAAHLLAIAIVVAESWLGITCPLTTLEQAFRERALQVTYTESFIEHWLSQLLFYEAPPWAFTLAYTGFGVLVLFTWWNVSPKWRGKE